MSPKRPPSNVDGGRDGEPAELTIEADRELTLDAVEEAARLWGGEWQRNGTGGRVELPVAAGIRRGTLVAEIETSKAQAATRLVGTISAENYRHQGRELVVLLMGALGGVFLMVAPFVPHLFDLIPLAGLLLLLAWFLVVSRLRNRSLVEFFDEVQLLTESVDDAQET